MRLRPPRSRERATIREARLEIEGVLEDSPSLGRETEALIKKQMRAAAELAADDLGEHGEPADALLARLQDKVFTAEQVLGDWFPNASV